MTYTITFSEFSNGTVNPTFNGVENLVVAANGQMAPEVGLVGVLA